MRDFLQGNRRAKLIDWLKIDSWIDSGLYTTWIGFRDWWAGYSSFFGRFEVKGVVRALNELACEGLTLERGRAVGARHLRASCLRDRARQDEPLRRIQRHLPRPLRQRDRQARPAARRLGAARRNPRRHDQGDARHRGSALLRAFRRRRHGHRSAPWPPTRGTTRWCKAAARSPSSSPRTCSCRRSGRSAARSKRRSSPSISRIALHQAGNPEALFRPRLSRRRLLRRRGGGPISISASRSAR